MLCDTFERLLRDDDLDVAEGVHKQYMAFVANLAQVDDDMQACMHACIHMHTYRQTDRQTHGHARMHTDAHTCMPASTRTHLHAFAAIIAQVDDDVAEGVHTQYIA